MGIFLRFAIAFTRHMHYTSQAQFLLPRKFRHIYVTLLRLGVGLESCIIAQREWLVLEKHIVTIQMNLSYLDNSVFQVIVFPILICHTQVLLSYRLTRSTLHVFLDSPALSYLAIVYRDSHLVSL